MWNLLKWPSGVTINRRFVLATAGLAACALVLVTISRGQRSTISTPADATVPSVLDGGTLYLADPTTVAPISASAAKSRIDGDPVMSHFVSQGFSPTIKYVSYTDTTFGSVVPGISPEAAATMQSSPSQSAKVSSLVFDHQQVWVAYVTVPASQVAFLSRGPRSASANLASDSASVVVLAVFDPVADRVLQLQTFPAGT
jgi:hypothetical protein